MGDICQDHPERAKVQRSKGQGGSVGDICQDHPERAKVQRFKGQGAARETFAKTTPKGQRSKGSKVRGQRGREMDLCQDRPEKEVQGGTKMVPRWREDGVIAMVTARISNIP